MFKNLFTKTFLAFLFAIMINFNLYANEQVSDNQDNQTNQYNHNIPNTIENILPSVVNISAEKTSNYIDIAEGYYEENTDEEPQSLGSGFIISDNGYVITNNHVIENADKVFVSLKGSTTKFPADIVGADKKTDIAVLKIDVKVKLPFVEFDNSDNYKVGDQIIVAGNPFNLGTSVSVGIISALNRDIQMSPFDNFIQTDAAINRGNSGGPMFNLDGKVIGITSAIYSPDGSNIGIGFAIPSSTAVPIIEKLKREGFVRRGWLGVIGAEADQEVLKTLGSYNGKKIKKLKDLPIMVSSTEIGSDASIVVYRNGKKLELNTKIAESKEYDKYDSDYEAIAGGAIEVFDMYVVPIDNAVKRKFKLGNQKGLFVLKIKKGGLADKKGIKNGDVILSANQMRTVSKENLIRILNELRRNRAQKVVLIINTHNNKNTVILMPLENGHDLNIKA